MLRAVSSVSLEGRRLFFSARVSEHTTTTVMARVCVSRARSRPFSFIMSAMARRSGKRAQKGSTWSASAICGTALGLTKLEASMKRTPAP